MKNIYLIVGQSGSGKSTIAESLESEYGLKAIQSYTTRPKRYENEKGHTFISEEEFDNLKDIVAFTEFCGYRYCTTAEQIENNALYIIDPAGVKSIDAFYDGNKQIKIIYIKSDLTTRFERMRFRSQHSGKKYLEAVDDSLKRIVNDANQFRLYESNETPIDCIVVNDWDSDIKSVTDKIYKFIIEAEKGEPNGQT